MSAAKRAKCIVKRTTTESGHIEELHPVEIRQEEPDDDEDPTNEIIVAQEGYLPEQDYETEQAEAEGIEQNQTDAETAVTAIDLMNYKLVRFEDQNGELGTHYRLVPNSNFEGNQMVSGLNGEVLLVTTGDAIDIESVAKSESGKELQGDMSGTSIQGTKYVQVQVEGSDMPLMMLACEQEMTQPAPTKEDEEEPEQEEKVKPRQLQQNNFTQKNSNFASNVASSRGGRRRSLPPARELLSCPNFKLFLYNCKHCDYQCNAIKDLTKHKQEKHAGTTRSRTVAPWMSMPGSRKPDLSPYSSGRSSSQKLQ